MFASDVAGFGEAVLVIARFALAVPETSSWAEPACCKFPLEVLMFSEYVPGGVAAVVVTVSVDDFADASVITMVVGLKLAVESLEKPEAVNEIVPVKPPTGVAVTVYVVLPPGTTVRELGSTEIE